MLSGKEKDKKKKDGEKDFTGTSQVFFFFNGLGSVFFFLWITLWKAYFVNDFLIIIKFFSYLN